MSMLKPLCSYASRARDGVRLLPVTLAWLRTLYSKPVDAITDVVRTLRLPVIPVRQRMRLVAVALRAWIVRRGDGYALEIPKKGFLYFSGPTLNSDWNAFSDVFLTRCYETDFEGIAVIDVGAHKGYFATLALLRGAARVCSVEPESRNYALLQRASRSFQQNDSVWEVRKRAVGSRREPVTLNLSGESWTHSLLPLPERGGRTEMAFEQVSMVPLADVIHEFSSPGMPLLVKIDIEGGECEAVLGTAVDVWQKVDEVFLAFHTFAPCFPPSLTNHLEAAGLIKRREVDDVTHYARSTTRDTTYD